ncbi:MULTISPECIES: hypothetical protein [unclassified Streptomyces]|uniref:hypothetical protein n=1 Tax=unclassified Streptomyces TaxID=2593676 RepID=UPI00382AEF81
MSAHQPSPAPERRVESPVAAARRAERETPPTMNELLAACAAASAVSTPPEAPAAQAESAQRADATEEAAGSAPASTQERDAA